MTQATFELRELERRFIVVGVPTAKISRVWHGQSYPWHYYAGKEVFLCEELHASFFVKKVDVQDLLDESRGDIPVAFRIRFL